MDFLNEDDVCGQQLLRLVSRGNSILAELYRLSDHVPRFEMLFVINAPKYCCRQLLAAFFSAFFVWYFFDPFVSLNACRVFLGPQAVQDPSNFRYLKVLFDYNYLKNPDAFERRLNQDIVSVQHRSSFYCFVIFVCYFLSFIALSLSLPLSLPLSLLFLCCKRYRFIFGIECIDGNFVKNKTSFLLQELLDIDDEFQENHSSIVERFYVLFEMIWKVIFKF